MHAAAGVSSCVMHMNICVDEAFAFTPTASKTKQPHLSTSCYSADIRLTDIYQPCEHTWSISVHVKGEPGRPALLHACFGLGGVR